MRRWMAILALTVGAWSQIPRDGSHQNQKAQPTANQANATQPAPPAEVRANSTEELQRTSPKPTKYPWKELLAPANVPNWALFLVGLGGVYAALRTLKSIENQAILMNRQTGIQEAAMSQWVEALFTGITTRVATKKPNSNNMETAAIELSGKVINRTPLPLTLKRVSVTISPIFDFEEFEVQLNEWLAPTSDPAVFGYAFQVKSTLDAEFTASLQRGELLMLAYIFVEFVEAHGTKREQKFTHFLECRMQTLRTLENYGCEIPRVEKGEKQK
jgi:hypothetical protein